MSGTGLLLPTPSSPQEMTCFIISFETNLVKALFAQEETFREGAWQTLEGSALHAREEFVGLGLGEFLSNLREWSGSAPKDEIPLIFNADEVKLFQWLRSLVPSASFSAYNQLSGSEALWLFPDQLAGYNALIVNVDEMMLSDILSAGPSLADLPGVYGRGNQLRQTASWSFHLHRVSFHDLL